MGASSHTTAALPAPLITGHTQLIAHIGYPTHTFKSPMIYNPYFAQAGINALVVPMGCQARDFNTFLPAIFSLTNICGALITMPHKVSVLEHLSIVSDTAKIAGACNAVKRNSNGLLEGELFDGEGFVRGLKRQGINPVGLRGIINGCGGVGSAIAAALAAAGLRQLQLHDTNAQAAKALANRINQFSPQCQASICFADSHGLDPSGFDLVVNCTPLGMNQGDPLPFNTQALSSNTFVGEVVLKTEHTPLLVAAQEKGCRFQVGTDMLFEQIPAYLEFFGLPTTDAARLRSLAQLAY